MEVLPAPTAVVDALATYLFEQLEDAFNLCISAETLGDFRVVKRAFEAIVTTVDRINERIESL